MLHFEENIDQQRKSIEAQIAEIDSLISLQLNEIIHHQDFQNLKASWCGLHYLVNEAQPNLHLKIKIFPATKRELLKDFERALEFDQSGLFKKAYDEVYSTFGAEPFGMLVGNYEFGSYPQDIALLEKISQVAAFAHSPFISTASAEMFGFDNFSQVNTTDDLSKIFDRPEYLKWLSFRRSDDAGYVGLTLPHISICKAREPEKGESLNFVKDATQHPTLGNAAYAFGTCVAKAYRESGWCGTFGGPESDGLIEGLSGFETDASKNTVDLLINREIEKQLSDLGFIAIVQNPTQNEISFFSAQSCRKPPKYDSDNANYFALQGCQLPYNFAMGRFAHYLKVIVRDRPRPFGDQRECRKELMRWIGQYYDFERENKPSRYPLSEFMINVVEIPDKPGEFEAVTFLRPAYLLEELPFALRRVVRLPKNQGYLTHSP